MRISLEWSQRSRDEPTAATLVRWVRHAIDIPPCRPTATAPVTASLAVRRWQSPVAVVEKKRASTRLRLPSSVINSVDHHPAHLAGPPLLPLTLGQARRSPPPAAPTNRTSLPMNLHHHPPASPPPLLWEGPNDVGGCGWFGASTARRFPRQSPCPVADYRPPKYNLDRIYG